MQTKNPPQAANAKPPRGGREPPPERDELMCGPITLNAEAPDAEAAQGLREFCTMLYRWRNCGEAMCRRHRRCCAPYGGC